MIGCPGVLFEVEVLDRTGLGAIRQTRQEARHGETEFMDGQPRKLSQRFRAYASPEESFRDFARLMKDNARYSGVLASGHSAERYAQGLQSAGYATDPDYAGKLGRVINTTLRLQRALG